MYSGSIPATGNELMVLFAKNFSLALNFFLWNVYNTAGLKLWHKRYIRRLIDGRIGISIFGFRSTFLCAPSLTLRACPSTVSSTFGSCFGPRRTPSAERRRRSTATTRNTLRGSWRRHRREPLSITFRWIHWITFLYQLFQQRVCIVHTSPEFATNKATHIRL